MPYSLTEFFRQRLRPLPFRHGVKDVQFGLGRAASRAALVGRIEKERPIVLADSGAFSGARAEFSVALLRTAPIYVPPLVVEEILRYLAQAPKDLPDASVKSELRKAFGQTVRPLDLNGGCLRESRRTATFYLNLLRLRRTELARNNRLALGVGSSVLAKKARPPFEPSDELVVVTAFLLAIRQSRRVYLITGDEDLCLQSYKLSSLLWDDYWSYLAASDFRDNRYLYGDPVDLGAFEAANDVCHPKDSFAVSRKGAPSLFSLMPSPKETFSLLVVNVRPDPPQIYGYSFPQGISRVLEIRARLGITTVGFGGLNCYHQIPGLEAKLDLRDEGPHMFFLRDKGVQAFPNSLPISMSDCVRALLEMESPLGVRTEAALT